MRVAWVSRKLPPPPLTSSVVARSTDVEKKLTCEKKKGYTNKLSHYNLYFNFYSYGHLQAINRTHLHWSWENTHENIRPVFQDYLWIVQENHGTRSAPEEQPQAPRKEYAEEEIEIVQI